MTRDLLEWSQQGFCASMRAVITPSSPPLARPDGAPLTRRASVVFGALDLLTAAAVFGLMRILWSSTSFWQVALGIWAVLLVASAIGLFSGTRAGRSVGRFAAFYQLCFLAVVVIGVLSSVAYLWGIYGQIGVGVSVALLIVLAFLFEVECCRSVISGRGSLAQSPSIAQQIAGGRGERSVVILLACALPCYLFLVCFRWRYSRSVATRRMHARAANGPLRSKSTRDTYSTPVSSE